MIKWIRSPVLAWQNWRQARNASDAEKPAVLLDDEFRKARRNLLWVGVGGVLLGLSRPIPKEELEAGEIVVSTLVGAVAIEGWLVAALLMPLILFLWWHFRREAHRIVLQYNSKIAVARRGSNAQALLLELNTNVEGDLKSARDSLSGFEENFRSAARSVQWLQHNSDKLKEEAIALKSAANVFKQSWVGFQNEKPEVHRDMAYPDLAEYYTILLRNTQQLYKNADRIGETAELFVEHEENVAVFHGAYIPV